MDLRVSAVTILVQTADRLREAILSGHFKPGHRLVENDLCQRLGVSPDLQCERPCSGSRRKSW